MHTSAQGTFYQCCDMDLYSDPWSGSPPKFNNLLIGHCQPSLKISCKSIWKFLRKVANRQTDTTTTTILRPFFRDYLGEPVPEEKLLDFMVQGKINRGRHTDHPAGRHSIRTNQCPPPPYPYFLLEAGCHSCHPTISVKALKSTSAFRLTRRC